MAFNFGNPSQPTFGAAPQKPVGFGSAFAPATTTPAGFGFGSTFGQQPTFGQQSTTSGFGQTQTAPAFGSTFGTTPASSAPAFGTTFGTQQNAIARPTFGNTFGSTAPIGQNWAETMNQTQQQAPTFGTTFGSTPSSVAPNFGTGTTFGTVTANTGLFGTTPAKPNLFNTPTNSAPSLFSTPATSAPLFGANTTTQTPNLFGTGTTPNLFGTNTLATTTATTTLTTTTPSLFGTPNFNTATTTVQPNLFGNTSTSGTGFGLFGSNTITTTAPSLFGGGGSSSFGTATAPLTTTTTTLPSITTNTTGFSFGSSIGGFGGFGTTNTSGPNLFSNTTFGNNMKPLEQFGQSTFQQQQQQTGQQKQNQSVMTSIYFINIFNDERDDILKKWNLLQACWGTGKGYYNANLPPIEYTPTNPFYRFKAVCYNIIPQYDNSEGLVKLTFNKKYSDLNGQRDVLCNGINGILGNKPNLKVNIIIIKALSDTKTEIRITVNEKGVTGNSRIIPAIELANFLNQPTQKQQLTNVGVTNIVALVTPTKSMLEEYLKTIPNGFDPQMWKAGIEDNPNPNKFMPMPVYGFEDLKTRKMMQEYEIALHRCYETQIVQELEELKKKYTASLAKINEYKQRFTQLQHRTLKILVRQESMRKAGLNLSPEEEFLKGKLETIYSHINISSQYKGKLNELISSIKLMDHNTKTEQPQYKLNPETQTELREYLQLQQSGISTLLEIFKEDFKTLNIISDGTRKILQDRKLLSS